MGASGTQTIISGGIPSSEALPASVAWARARMGGHIAPQPLYNTFMVVAVDIGNSTVSIGLFEGGEFSVHRLDPHAFMRSSEYAEAIRGLLDGRNAEGAIICSVVPEITDLLWEGAEACCRRSPFVIGPSSAHGLRLDVAEPSELGPDRIAAASGAAAAYGAPVAVVDFGTATTVSFVAEGDVFLGGAIMPGVGVMLGALHEKTARLPMVGPAAVSATPGRDTRAAMLLGAVVGSAGAVEKIIAAEEAATARQYAVAVTGGHAEHVLPHLGRKDHVEPALTLKGLVHIYGEEVRASA